MRTPRRNLSLLLAIALVAALVEPQVAFSQTSSKRQVQWHSLSFPKKLTGLRLLTPRNKVVNLRGQVKLPKHYKFTLQVWTGEMSTLKELEKVPISSITAINAREQEIDDKEAAILLRFRQANFIDLSGTDVSDKTAGIIASFENPETVLLPRTFVKLKGIEKLVANNKIKQLNIADNLLGKGLGKILSQNKSICYLNVSKNKLDDQEVEQICKQKQLRTLSLSFNAKITNKSIKYITQLKDLESLASVDTAFTAEALRPLGKLKRLQRISLRIKPPAMSRAAARRALPERIQIDGIKDVVNVPLDIFRPLH